jgi:hypothetical protein
VSIADGNPISIFVNAPTPENYNMVVLGLKANKVTNNEWVDFQKNYKEMAKFIQLVESSNALAIDLSIRLMPISGGGNLEDICRAVGGNIRSNPVLILQKLKENQASENLQKCVLLILPVSTVDNNNSMVAELEARVAAVAKVDDQRLREYKLSALSILNNEVYFLRGEKSFIIR